MLHYQAPNFPFQLLYTVDLFGEKQVFASLALYFYLEFIFIYIYLSPFERSLFLAYRIPFRFLALSDFSEAVSASYLVFYKLGVFDVFV